MPFVNGKWVEPNTSQDPWYGGGGSDSSNPAHYKTWDPISKSYVEGDPYKQNQQQLMQHGLAGVGNRFGDWARSQIGNTAPMVTVDHAALDADRQTAQQSYQQQQQALGMMQAAAQGQGPSVAALQSQAGQDAAVQQMMQGGRAGLMQNYGTQAASDAATARAQEIGQAQQSWAQGAENLRQGSLQDRQQALQNSYQASQLAQMQQQQDLDRRMKLEQLAQGGYGAQQGYLNDLASAQLGQQGIEMQNAMNQQAAMMNMYGSLAGAFGSQIPRGGKGNGNG